MSKNKSIMNEKIGITENRNSELIIRNSKIPELRFPEFEKEGGWEEKKLGEVADIITGNTPSTKEIENYNGEKLFVTPADINGNRFITQTKTTLTELGFSKTRHIEANSVLFVCIGSTIGKIAQNKVECATNQQINSLIPLKEYSSGFLYSALENSVAQISELAGIQAVPIINKSQFSAVKLFFPRSKEQQKIASCLSSLDELIEAHSQKLNLLKDHKKGLMQNLFPQEGEKVPKYRFPEFRNEGEWVEKKLGEIAENLDSKRVPITSTQREKGNIPYYGASGIVDYVKDYIFNETLLCVSEDGANLIDRNYPIAFTIIGKTWVNNHAHVLKFENLNTHILVEKYINSISIEDFLTGMAQPKLNRGNLDVIPIPIPQNPEEQQKIASTLSSLDELITAQVGKIEQLKEHKKGLMQGLFPKSITN